MTTDELVAFVRRLDPSGKAEVVQFAAKQGYETVCASHFQTGAVVMDAIRKPETGVGRHLCAADYAIRFPHGGKKAVPVLVLPAVAAELALVEQY